MGDLGDLMFTLGWKSFIEKLVGVFWVFVGGGLGPLVGGSIVGLGLVPAWYTTIV